MTPHLGDYYQGKNNGATTPNTSLTPNPIPFLAVPADSAFLFHVGCIQERIDDPELRKKWKSLVKTAFDHATQWLGFGAKTAVGYGRMKLNEKAVEEQRQIEEKAAEEARRKHEAEERERKLSTMTPLDRTVQEVIDARPQGQSELKALFNAFKENRWQGDEARTVAANLKMRMQTEKHWKEKSEKKKPEKDEDYQMSLAVMAALRTL
jgi:CRISPR-associated protein Cmr6